MENFKKALKAGFKGFTRSFEPSRYLAAALPVTCTHCKGDRFIEREVMLNTSAMTLVGLDWLNDSGTALVCENCGLIHWFAKKPERISSQPM